MKTLPRQEVGPGARGLPAPASGQADPASRSGGPHTHLQLRHGHDPVVVGVNQLLELSLPVSHPAVIHVLALLVLHGAHGQRDELGQRELLVTILVCGTRGQSSDSSGRGTTEATQEKAQLMGLCCQVFSLRGFGLTPNSGWTAPPGHPAQDRPVLPSAAGPHPGPG